MAEIAKAVDVHPKTVSRVLKLHQKTGWIRKPHCEMKRLGRPRKLDNYYESVGAKVLMFPDLTEEVNNRPLGMKREGKQSSKRA